ncbi:MAG: hypothetical protein WCE46_00655 [Methanoregula sp.]|uniref:hypothetical protein n=1 Tax=Methanoregula sp. TaxID=2052170 RepID=UPI003C76A147
MDNISTIIIGIIIVFAVTALWIAFKVAFERYFKKLLDILDKKIPHVAHNFSEKLKNYKIYLQLFYSFKKLLNQNPKQQKKSLEVILKYISSPGGKKFASKHDVITKITSVCETGEKETNLMGLQILFKIINIQGLNLQIKGQSLSIIINLLSDQDPEIRRRAMENLVLLGNNGKQKDLLFAMIEEREPYIEVQLSYLCVRLFQVFSPKIFIDNQTIQPIFRFLKYNDDLKCLRYNLLSGLNNCAFKDVLTMQNIVDYDSNNCFKKILETGANDERECVLSILQILARSQQQKQIVEANFVPLVIQNLQHNDNVIKDYSKTIIRELLKCDETKSIIENLITDLNINNLLNN